ncbi:MAG TPA: hypothetical protein PLW01_03015 [Agitococcus sp.]|nr:hypothetical protein [Agitococcus sp.]
MANLPLITVVADVVGTLINGHYRHQQQMTQLENEYRLEKARIEQDTTLSCKKIDATLSYALKDLEARIKHQHDNFALLVQSLDLQLEDNRILQQRINDLMKVATNPQEVPEIRLIVLQQALPAMMKTQQQQAKQRHALLIQQLQNNSALANNPSNLLLK